MARSFLRTRTSHASAAPVLGARVSHVFFDVDHPEVAHTRIDCPENGGLIELVETYLGGPCDDPVMFEYVADVHGFVSPAHLVHQARPCPHCTLVAAPSWRTAA
ncbi:MAG: hypothetical protein U0Q03_16640 [Acidimicrobiales bacterium]